MNLFSSELETIRYLIEDKINSLHKKYHHLTGQLKHEELNNLQLTIISLKMLYLLSEILENIRLRESLYK